MTLVTEQQKLDVIIEHLTDVIGMHPDIVAAPDVSSAPGPR